MNCTKNKLRVIHIPQLPMKSFKVEVRNEREAYLLTEAFANQHLFLFENNVIPDYSNIILVECFENGEWCDYYNEIDDLEWDDFIQEYADYLA